MLFIFFAIILSVVSTIALAITGYTVLALLNLAALAYGLFKLDEDLSK